MPRASDEQMNYGEALAILHLRVILPLEQVDQATHWLLGFQSTGTRVFHEVLPAPGRAGCHWIRFGGDA